MQPDLEGKSFTFYLYRPDLVKHNVLEFKGDIKKNPTLLDITNYADKIMEWFKLDKILFFANKTKMSYYSERELEMVRIKFRYHLAGFENIYEIRRRSYLYELNR